MATYKTPGVYVEEVSTLPPSVASVATAIPAFFGYTETGAPASGANPQAVRISTMLEFEQTFGGAKPESFTVTTSGDGVTTPQAVASITNDGSTSKFILYYAVKHYFDNGGGPCYIVSVGDYAATPTGADFEKGLAAIAKEDEPTLLVLTDAVGLDSASYYPLCVKVLDQAKALGDRFGVFDVLDTDSGVADFRQNLVGDLAYGAAYTPYLNTTISYAYTDDTVTVSGSGGSANQGTADVEGAIKVIYNGPASDGTSYKVVQAAGEDLSITVGGGVLTIRGVSGGKTGTEIKTVWDAVAAKGSFDIQVIDGTKTVSASVTNGSFTYGAGGGDSTLTELKSSNLGLYNRVKAQMGNQRITLPPSAAIAGVYASVDRDRGVWKAPANVAVKSVLGPTQKITDEEQQGLNVDESYGKSINAIRSFTGKGTIVWGARTLAGNDNEWRYVSVRRLFNMIEESTKKASDFAVFEPNDATTWLKVKSMIESFLYGLWQQGALMGGSPEAAYFVNVGLGTTMTQQDVLEGRMVVEIGIAAVRPAEFIILRFSHKMMEA